MSVALGTSRRTSTPDRAAARQRLDVQGRACVVGVGQPHALSCQRGDELVEAEHAGRGRPVATMRRLTSPAGGRRRHLLVRDRLARHRPDLRERALDVRDGRAAHLDAGVAPRLDPFCRVAHPHPPHAQAGDEADLAVHREHLAVVARDPAERASSRGGL